MDDRDTCPVCFEHFTLPKLLPCQHTFCLKCLKDYCNQLSIQENRDFKREPPMNKKSHHTRPRDEIVCPLCRNVCKIPTRGIQDLLTNYFVQTSPPPPKCEFCEEEDIMEYCSTCFKRSCNICFRIHEHERQTSTDEDETETRDPRLPFHLMIVGGIKTEYIYELKRTFKLDVPPNDEGMRPIVSVFAGKNGGTYVLPRTVPFILKFESNGTLIVKIRTPEPCFNIIELENEDLLGIFRLSRLILRCSFGGWSHFATVSDFFPMALTELSDGRILVCGINELPSDEEKDKDIYGIIRVYSKEGVVLSQIEKEDKECRLLQPDISASNKREKTFSVGDQIRHSVTVFRENGDELNTYNGGLFMLKLPVPLFQMDTPINFQPIEMCCSRRGNYVISSADGTLHVLDPYGKLLGIALANCEDGFGRFTDVSVDVNDNIWCSNSELGTIKIFRLVKLKNHLNR